MLAIYSRRPLMLLLNSIIDFGQAYLTLDGIGVDALVIGFLVAYSLKIRTRFYK